MADDFDLEELVNVEQTFYAQGYTDGHAHGRVHGLVEGRALGREKGFEMWEELGFYEGFARMCAALLRLRAVGTGTGAGTDERAQNHIRHLLELIARFPRVNPSSLPGDDPEADADADIPRLFRQIRSRYKLLCATLGVRPSLRAAAADSSDASPSPSRGEEGNMNMNMNVNVNMDGGEAREAPPDRPRPRPEELGHDDLGGGLDMAMTMDVEAEVEMGTPGATGRVATRTERKKKAAVWAVHDLRADSGSGGGGGGGGTELSF